MQAKATLSPETRKKPQIGSPIKERNEDDPFIGKILKLLPSELAEGCVYVFRKEVPFTLILEDKTEEKRAEVKLTVQIAERVKEEAPVVKLQISSEEDLYLCYLATITEPEFREIRNKQHWKGEFMQFASSITEIFKNCLAPDRAFFAELRILAESQAVLQLKENVGFKTLEIVQLSLEIPSTELIERHILHRFVSLKARMRDKQDELQKISQVIKTRNPTLFMEIARASESVQDTGFKVSPKRGLVFPPMEKET